MHKIVLTNRHGTSKARFSVDNSELNCVYYVRMRVFTRVGVCREWKEDRERERECERERKSARDGERK